MGVRSRLGEKLLQHQWFGKTTKGRLENRLPGSIPGAPPDFVNVAHARVLIDYDAALSNQDLAIQASTFACPQRRSIAPRSASGGCPCCRGRSRWSCADHRISRDTSFIGRTPPLWGPPARRFQRRAFKAGWALLYAAFIARAGCSPVAQR